MLRREFVVVPESELTPDREKQLLDDGFEKIGESPGLSGWLFGRRGKSENPGGRAVYDWAGTLRLEAEGERAVALLEAAAQGLVANDPGE